MDLLEICTEYDVNVEKCNPQVRDLLIDEFGLTEENGMMINLTGEEIAKYGVNASAIDYDSAEYLEEMLEDILYSKLGKYPYYLVFASGCKWNGASGYKFCTNIIDTVTRDYDISISIIEEGKHAIKCRESSHDVPTGSTTYICGVTEDEYEKLENASFDEIESFAINKF